MYKKLKLVESASDRYQVREFDGPGAKFGVYDTKEKKFVQKGSKKVMTAACEDLNKKKSLKEESTEEYWDATEIARDGFMSLMKFNFGTDFRGNNYIITVDANDVVRFRANNDEEAIEKYNQFKNDWNNSDHADLTMDIKSIAPRNESENLTEDIDDEDIEKIQDEVEEDNENQEELEDTLDSEEDQEENPVEEESELDKELNELRDILVDLDLKLYQITDKEDLNNSIYIIGKVAEDSNDVLMLVDTKPEEVNSEDTFEEEPIINNVDIDTDIKEDDKDLEEADERTYKDEDEAEYYRNKELYASSNLARHREAMEKAAKACKEKGIKLEEAEDIETSEEEEDNKTELEQRFDFVKLPNSFEEVNKLNPRYGEELTPDHEAIVEYLMNCLIEINPEAAEELQKEQEPEELPIEEPSDDIDLGIDINGEEDLENEDEY